MCRICILLAPRVRGALQPGRDRPAEASRLPCWLAPRGGRSGLRSLMTAHRTLTARRVRSEPWLPTEAAVAENATVQQEGRGEIERLSLYALPSTCDAIEDDGA